MSMKRPLSVHQVKADWLRVQGEVAYVRMLVAGQRWIEALRREERESLKYSPDQPRVPAGNSDGGQWTSEGGGGGEGTGTDVLVGGGGKDKIGNTASENPRARIGNNRPPLQNGTYLGRAGSALGRYVFGPAGALIGAILSSDPLNNDEQPGNATGGNAEESAEVIGPYAGGKTEGVLETVEGDFYLKSGWTGPAKNVPRGASGFNIVTLTHVEGHAVAVMRQLGLKEARVYINNPEVCQSCLQNLPKMLSPG